MIVISIALAGYGTTAVPPPPPGGMIDPQATLRISNSGNNTRKPMVRLG